MGCPGVRTLVPILATEGTNHAEGMIVCCFGNVAVRNAVYIGAGELLSTPAEAQIPLEILGDNILKANFFEKSCIPSTGILSRGLIRPL